jgi:hypothetical protein
MSFFDKGRFHYLKGLSITPSLCIAKMHTAATQKADNSMFDQTKRRTQDAAWNTKVSVEQS